MNSLVKHHLNQEDSISKSIPGSSHACTLINSSQASIVMPLNVALNLRFCIHC